MAVMTIIFLADFFRGANINRMFPRSLIDINPRNAAKQIHFPQWKI